MLFPTGTVLEPPDLDSGDWSALEWLYRDVPDDFENEQGATLDEYLEWEERLKGDEDAARYLAAAAYTPGQLTGAPGCGSHSPPSNCPFASISRANGCPPGDSPCNWQSVNGYDIYTYPGTPVLAPVAGKISNTLGYNAKGGDGGRFAGCRLHIEAAGGLLIYMTHMRNLTVARGAHVAAGAIIGHSGIAIGFPHTHMACNPPFNPRTYALRIYNKNARRSPTKPQPGGQEPIGTLLPSLDPAPKTVNDAWHDLMLSRMGGRRNREALLEKAVARVEKLTL